MQQANGRSISLFGAYKAAKGQRPEIILPQPASIGLDAATVKKKIEPGQVVRILSGDHAGKVGTIKHIYTHLQPLEIGLKVPGVDVSLADGKILFVPSANLDVIV